MRYKLKTVKNEKNKRVFAREKRGTKIVYLAKSEAGEVGEVDKIWILKNKENIINLGVSGTNIYPVVNKDEKVECCQCGITNKISAMKPVYGYNGGLKIFGYICKKCLKDYFNEFYYQCADCKRIFAADGVNVCDYEPERTGYRFSVYKASSDSLGNVECVCQECDGGKYYVCSACECGYQCIVKTSSIVDGYNCPAECVDMIKEQRECGEVEDEEDEYAFEDDYEDKYLGEDGLYWCGDVNFEVNDGWVGSGIEIKNGSSKPVALYEYDKKQRCWVNRTGEVRYSAFCMSEKREFAFM